MNIYNKGVSKMAKIIRLSENRLIELIETAIKETDWRTYFDAAKRSFARGERGEHSRGNKFEQMGLQQLMADPAFDEVGKDFNINRWSADINLLSGDDEENYTIDKHGYTKHNKNGYDFHELGDDGSESEHPIINKLANYYSGHSKFQKGKGWTESVIRRVSENVIHALLNTF